MKFLTQWEYLCLDYYIKKISLTLIEPHSSYERYRSRYNEMKASVDKLGHYLMKNMKENNIAKLSEYFNHKTTKFSDFKEAYRLVVGHVFSKAHREIS